MGVIKWKRFSEDELRDILNNNNTFKGALKDLGYNTTSNNNKIIKEIAKYLKYDLSSYIRGKEKTDFIGLIFGELTIVEIDEEKSKEKKRTWVKAKCSCGKIISVSYNALQRNNTKTCGHTNFLRENIIGKKYNRWTVLEYIGNKNNQPYYLCQCECGIKKEVGRNNLVRGASKSCGCLQKEIVSNLNFQDLQGKIFGELEVIELDTEKTKEKKQSIWKCKCSCGKIIYINTSMLNSGNTRSCGCSRKSLGERTIKEILEKNNISFCEQYSFSDLKGDVNPLKFDFAIFKEGQLKYLIEFQGKQHYEPIKYFGGQEQFIKQQKYDTKKREYCLKNKIPLIEISYAEKITDNLIIRKEFLC